MHEKYSIQNLNTQEIIETNVTGLKEFIKTCFPDGNQKFWDHLYFKRLQNSNYPYTNGQYIITCLSAKKKRNKSLDFSTKYNLQANIDKNACPNKKLNQWTVFNNKTGLYYSYHSLAALARALDLNYSWLYARIRYNTAFAIGNYTFTYDTVLESEFVNARLQEIV